jgi:hypothetical protein
MIGVADPLNPSQSAKEFREILTNIGIELTYTTWYDAKRASNTQFDIFICPE